MISARHLGEGSKYLFSRRRSSSAADGEGIPVGPLASLQHRTQTDAGRRKVRHEKRETSWPFASFLGSFSGCYGITHSTPGSVGPSADLQRKHAHCNKFAPHLEREFGVGGRCKQGAHKLTESSLALALDVCPYLHHHHHHHPTPRPPGVASSIGVVTSQIC